MWRKTSTNREVVLIIKKLLCMRLIYDYCISSFVKNRAVIIIIICCGCVTLFIYFKYIFISFEFVYLGTFIGLHDFITFFFISLWPLWIISETKMEWLLMNLLPKSVNCPLSAWINYAINSKSIMFGFIVNCAFLLQSPHILTIYITPINVCETHITIGNWKFIYDGFWQGLQI
jgi:hypothetical protein